MQRLEVSDAVRPVYGSLGVKGLRIAHCLRVFKSEVLRKIFGPKWEEATGDWRKLYSEELHD